MAGYEAISRRPIAAAFRRTAKGATRFCVRWGIHPDAISYLSILAALAVDCCAWLASAQEAAPGSRHVVLVVWDGMRPDMMTEKNCPVLWRQA